MLIIGDRRARGIRRKALQKIAALSVTSSGKSQGNPDLERLYNIFPSRSNSKAGLNGHADEDSNVPLGGVAMVLYSIPSEHVVRHY